ncbi:GNAT family N-acetyltransferase [Glaciecola sp. 1036]|uniref:GNAT family N-acetyltransferase n=1 Tax=Alteromonadaceae TaxID=72275 RepID=UPI003CFC8272
MVLLRDFQQNDLPKLVDILNDKSVNQFLSTKIPSPYTPEDASWWITEGSKGDLIKAIEFDSQLVGCIGVTRGEFEYQRTGELGYWLDAEYWRKGITSQAIEMLLEQVFSKTDIVRIFATVFSSNLASMQLLINSGFKHEAILEKSIFKNGKFYDSHIFAKVRVH